MSEVSYTKFQIRDIVFPKMEGMFLAVPSEDFNYAFRVEGNIPSPKIVQLIFGIKVFSKDMIDAQTSKASITVDVIGQFEFEHDLPIVNHVSKLPLVANQLAVLYPYIREKVSYFLSSNKVNVYLPSINTIELIKHNINNPDFKVVDFRSLAQSEQKNSTVQ